MHSLDAKRQSLLHLLGSYPNCAVAFSAGVDSCVVAKAAYLALGDAAVAVTGDSYSLAAGELQQARQLAEHIGIQHHVISTQEFDRDDYLRNTPDRCFHCKTELYTQMHQFAQRLGITVLANGANADDLGDFRPGLQAASEHGVTSPLAECEISKAEVRQLAAQWQLPIWNKPATPCLSSRIAYGEPVTPERLAMIDQAEQYLRGLGLVTVRVRYHKGDLARLEVPTDQIGKLCQKRIRDDLNRQFRSLGFKYITLDLEGFRSGSLNALIPPESLQKWK